MQSPLVIYMQLALVIYMQSALVTYMQLALVTYMQYLSFETSANSIARQIRVIIGATMESVMKMHAKYFVAWALLVSIHSRVSLMVASAYFSCSVLPT
jgi:membrane-anchored glycerophosphoryl diester phosphodiesterase (GDPDase)